MDIDWDNGDICEIHDSPDECAEADFSCDALFWDEFDEKDNEYEYGESRVEV